MSETKEPLRTVRVAVHEGRVLVFRAAEPIRKGQDVGKVDDQTVRVFRPGDVLVGRADDHSLPT